MTVGYYAPPPSARSGVADYAATLASGLRRYGEVRTGLEGDVNLYHIGNNALHAADYWRALDRPGVVVLHDALLQHLFFGILDEDRYVAEFTYNYGAWSRDLATDLWRSRMGSGMREEYYRYPMLKRLAESALAVVVHNPAAARIVRDHAASVGIVEIPHLFDATPFSCAEALRWRQDQGIPAGVFLFGLFGYLRESKRVTPTLRAFERVRAGRPDCALLVSGEFASADLERAAEPLLRTPGVFRVPRLSEREFWLAASAVDACVNLRDPSAGETSGVAIRLMGLGKAVLVTDGEEVSRIPGDACFRIDRGPSEEDMLAEAMLTLCRFPEIARGAGLAAARHIAEHHVLEHVARLYWEELCACLQRF